MLKRMDRRQDGHAWTKTTTTTTNITDHNGQLSFRYVKCLEHLRCEKIACPHFKHCRNYNKKYEEGSTCEVLISCPITEVLWKYSVFYQIRKSIPSCLKLCPWKMFNITSKNLFMSQTWIYFGTHDHLVATGD